MTDPPEQSGAPTRGGPASATAWRSAARALLRRRDAAGAAATSDGAALPCGYFERATCVSFRMDGVPLTEQEYRAALARRAVTTGAAPGAAPGAHRARAAQRVRNHVAVLHRIESLLRRGQPLQVADVVRWYTSIACGLSAGGLAAGTLARIDRTVSAVNSPRLRFWPAVKEVAALHVRLLDDPFVPGFNGILARFLLRYHMGRCGLPPVVFDPVQDPQRLTSPPKLEARLLELIVQSRDGNGTP